MTQIFPAPWHLKGSGYVLVYRFPKERHSDPFFNNTLTEHSGLSGFGALMLVDYSLSTAGPYRELLFTPGQIKFNGRKHHSVTKIYVSTMESVMNGRKNWGIPKESADFTTVRAGERLERFSVSRGNEKIMDITIKKRRLSLPVTTALFPLKLLQEADGGIYKTRPKAAGRARLAKIKSIKINPDLFPDISSVKPLLCFHVDNFSMIFPRAAIQPQK